MVKKLSLNWIKVFLKNMGESIKNYRYWIASSYNIPTEKMLLFFRKNYRDNILKSSTIIKPVLAHYLVFPALLLIMIANILSLGRTYSLVSIMLVIFFYSFNMPSLRAEDKEIDKKIEETNYSLWNKHKQGELDRKESLALANNLLRSNEFEEALTLYQENMSSYKETSPDVLMNFGVALALNKQKLQALKVFYYLKKELRSKHRLDKLREKDLKNNILLILGSDTDQKEQDQKEQDQKEQDQKEQDQKEQDQKEQGQKEQGQKEQDQKEQGQKEQDQKEQDQKEQDQKEQDQKEQDQKEQGQKEQGQKEQGQKEQGQKEQGQKEQGQKEQDQKEQDLKHKNQKNKENLSEDADGEKTVGEKIKSREDNIKQKRKRSRLPAILKQVLDEDRSLQKKFF